MMIISRAYKKIKLMDNNDDNTLLKGLAHTDLAKKLFFLHEFLLLHM